MIVLLMKHMKKIKKLKKFENLSESNVREGYSILKQLIKDKPIVNDDENEINEEKNNKQNLDSENNDKEKDKIN